MLKRECVYCKASISDKFLCDECENVLILGCQKRVKYLKGLGRMFELTYFWDFNNMARKSIISGKYRFNKECFKALSEIAYSHYVLELDFKGKITTFVPTTYLRYCYRGFNQAKIICEEFKCRSVSILQRFKYVSSQLKNSESQRRNRIRQFEVKGKIMPESKIVIFDDVCTTGSTLLMCAEEILKVQPNCSIEFLTLAYRRTYKYSED